MNAYENNILLKIKIKTKAATSLKGFVKISNTKSLFSVEIYQQQQKKGITSIHDLILYFDILQRL